MLNGHNGNRLPFPLNKSQTRQDKEFNKTANFQTENLLDKYNTAYHPLSTGI